MEAVDYIIVGGGAAGCVLANQLSADPSRSVLLLEAGPPSERLMFQMPTGAYVLLARILTIGVMKPSGIPSINGRRVAWTAGRTLGGGSAINGMVYLRGDKRDYDAWAAAGCVGWSWDDVLPYFKKAEDFQGEPTPSMAPAGPCQSLHCARNTA